MMSSQNLVQQAVTFTVSAPGKVILHGEHSVVFGKLSIAASLDLRTYVHLEEINFSKGNENFFIVNLESLNVKSKIDLKRLKVSLLDALLPLQAKESEFNWKVPQFIDQAKLQARIEEHVKSEDSACAQLALTIILFLFSGIMASVDCEITPLVLTIRSDVTPGSGSGSSASLAVSLAGAFIHYIKLKTVSKTIISKSSYKVASWENVDMCSFSSEELDVLCKWAYLAECIAHGKPSGIDNTVSTYGSLVLFRRETPPRTLPRLSGNVRLLLINTKVSRSTKDQVAKLCDIRSRHEIIAEKMLDVMDEVAQSAVEHLQILDKFRISSDGDLPEDFQSNFKKLEQKNRNKQKKTHTYKALVIRIAAVLINPDFQGIMELTNINQNLLRAFGQSHPKLDEICSILTQHQLVGKLTGAGGGGNAISYVPPNYSAGEMQQVIQTLQNKGFEASIVNLGGRGVHIHSTPT